VIGGEFLEKWEEVQIPRFDNLRHIELYNTFSLLVVTSI
jgi:hypothetical protein